MCLAIYLASSQELPSIAWNEEKPAFHVLHLPKHAESVRKHFRSEYVYYVGSEQGCSCAFNYEHESDAIIDLRNYLRNALICVDQVEMFVCNSGTEEMERKHALMVSPDRIAMADFCFKDGQYLVVNRGRQPETATEAEKCLESVTRPVGVATAGCTRLSRSRKATFPGLPLFAGSQ